MTLRKSAPHARPRWLGLFSLVALGLLLIATSAFAGIVSTNAGFEGSDGNLAPNTPPDPPSFDWNSFATTTWTGTAPYRTSTKLVSGWDFTGLEDDQNSGADTVFAGGTKQDNACAKVQNGPKPPNKDDLKRIYVANKTVDIDPTAAVDNHLFLALAWVRIPQNTTSASAHVAFEFNQNQTLCGGNSDGLVTRSVANGGDMLIVYDFEGSSTDAPALKLSRWIASGACEVASNSPPCWGNTQLLSGSISEGKVNTSDVGSVSDTISPTSPTAESLGNNEFGEAIIDLTGAGVFPSTPTSCVSFGKVFAVSRSSGNSGQAQMKDLVGPGGINISNCATVIIRKQTIPDEDPNATDFGYTKNFNTDPSSANTFTLKDDGVKSYTGTVFFGTGYTVTEDVIPSGWAFTSLDCSASSAGVTPSITAATVTFALDDNSDVLDCTYTNTQQKGAIEVTKTRKNASAASGDPNSQPHAGVTFTVTDPSDNTVATGVTDASGVICFDGLPLNVEYTVTETVPDGYTSDDSVKEATPTASASCADDPFTGSTLSFHNSPLTDLSIDVTSQDPGATKSTINCVDASDESIGSSGAAADPASLVVDDLAIGTYVCTILIDP